LGHKSAELPVLGETTLIGFPLSCQHESLQPFSLVGSFVPSVRPSAAEFFLSSLTFIVLAIRRQFAAYW
jgi:hypothetical protein